MADGRKDRHLTEQIRLGKDTMEKIEQIQCKTRLTKSSIASTLIEYALDHVKLIPAECYDIEFD